MRVLLATGAAPGFRAFSALASTKRWRGALQRVWTPKSQTFLRMVAGMGLSFIAGPRIGNAPPSSGWRASEPLLQARRRQENHDVGALR